MAPDFRIDIKVDAFLPDTYIRNHDLRMDMYKRISAIRSENDLSDTLSELLDRFGDIPQSVMNLTDIAYIKATAESLGINEITDVKDSVSFLFETPDFFDFKKISDIAEAYPGQILINANHRPGFCYRLKQGEQDRKIENIKNILQMLKSSYQA